MPDTPKEVRKGNETTKRGQGPPDPNRRAWEIVQQAVGELPKEEAPKDTPRVTIGRMGGLKGGEARKAALTPEQRKAIAKKAAQKRWDRDSR